MNFTAGDIFGRIFPEMDFGTTPRYAGKFKHERFPHFFQFETVYSKLDDTFYTIINQMPDGTYAIMDTLLFDAGDVTCMYKTHHWCLEKLLD